MPGQRDLGPEIIASQGQSKGEAEEAAAPPIPTSGIFEFHPSRGKLAFFHRIKPLSFQDRHRGAPFVAWGKPLGMIPLTKS